MSSVEKSPPINHESSEAAAPAVEVFGSRVLEQSDLKEAGKQVVSELKDALAGEKREVPAEDGTKALKTERVYRPKKFLEVAEHLATLKGMGISVKNPPEDFKRGIERGMKVLQHRPEMLARYAAVMKSLGLGEITDEMRSRVKEALEKNLASPEIDESRLAALSVNAKILGIEIPAAVPEELKRRIGERLTRGVKEGDMAARTFKLAAQLKYLQGDAFKSPGEEMHKAMVSYLEQSYQKQEYDAFADMKRRYNQIWPERAKLAQDPTPLIEYAKTALKKGFWQALRYISHLKEIEAQQKLKPRTDRQPSKALEYTERNPDVITDRPLNEFESELADADEDKFWGTLHNLDRLFREYKKPNDPSLVAKEKVPKALLGVLADAPKYLRLLAAHDADGKRNIAPELGEYLVEVTRQLTESRAEHTAGRNEAEIPRRLFRLLSKSVIVLQEYNRRLAEQQQSILTEDDLDRFKEKVNKVEYDYLRPLIDELTKQILALADSDKLGKRDVPRVKLPRSIFDALHEAILQTDGLGGVTDSVFADKMESVIRDLDEAEQSAKKDSKETNDEDAADDPSIQPITESDLVLLRKHVILVKEFLRKFHDEDRDLILDPD